MTVEIWHDGSWGTVCDDLWDLADANVVCQQLGCGSAVAALGGAAFGPGNGTIWLDDVWCKGSESSLWDCPASSWDRSPCVHEEDADVMCSGFVQLVEGDGPCNGRVEFDSETKWNTVCDWNFTLCTAKVICAVLECGTAVSIMKGAHFGRGNGPILYKEFQCNGSEPFLSLCPMVPLPQGKCSHSMDVGVICSRYADFRLMDGSSQCKGRVEIQVLGTWRTLCDSHWDLADANILYHQPHCGVALKPPEEAHFGRGSVQIIGDTFYCTGTEFDLWNCSVTILGTSPCSTGKVASVPRWTDKINCQGQESFLWHCSSQSWDQNSCQQGEETFITCEERKVIDCPTSGPCTDKDKLRLIGGETLCSGRVEIWHNGSWGTVCDDSWDLADANVVCQHLSCGSAMAALEWSAFSPGNGTIWLDEVQCRVLSSYRDSLHEAVYQEIDYSLTGEKKELLSRPGSIVGNMNEVGALGPTNEWHEQRESNTVLYAQYDFINKMIGLHNCSENVYLPGAVVESLLPGRDTPGAQALLAGRSWCPRAAQSGAAADPPRTRAPECDKDALRLMGGDTRCFGRVEIWLNGSWGTVCDDSWDLADAKVVCQQLGCGSALAALEEAAFGPGNGAIWLDDVQCNGNESSLWDCPASSWGESNCDHSEDAGVMCSEFVKLVEGDGPCNGRVEVNSETKWNTVCDWNFTFSTANVICAELECGTAVSIMKEAHFGRGNGPILDKEFQCNGSEPFLSLCPVVPLPQRYTDFRLMDGSSQCEGRVEIQVLGTWRTLCDSHWDLADANVLCRQLHCGVAMKPPEDAHFGKAASVVCSGNQTRSLTFNNSQSDQEKAPVLFSENGLLRLLNGRGPCSGRVEVYYNGTWGTICDDSWDLSDAHVVCRQLGCGVALEAMISAHFGQGSGPIWLDELSCSGNESHLGECPSLHWGQHDCRHKEDAGVLCSDSLDLRLVSEDQKCSGWLEVFYNGTWGSVCSNSMDDNTVSVICRHLNCGTKGNIETLFSPPNSLQPRWIDKINCQGHESFLWHCLSQSWDQNSCQQGEEAIITCEGKKIIDCPTSGPCTDKDKLRLIGGGTPCSGRVEIWHDGSWGTVCDDSWDLADANVVCQQLGCGSALTALEGAAFGPGTGTIWLDDVQCQGRESSLWDCRARPWGKNDCKHEEDAGVKCSVDRTTLASTTEGTITTTDSSPLISGNSSLLWIICLILGALLFLVLILLGIQVHRGSIQQQALSRYRDSLYEAVYQEIDYYLTGDKKELLSSPDISGWPDDPPGDGYDDAEELSGPEITPVPQMNEGDALEATDEWDEQKESNTGVSPEFFGGSPDSRMGEDAPPMSSEDLGYDEAEIGVPQMSL
ncbi:antigen WC1.1-like [Notamacropus eugenii]|uniref:antigen WC1.1-like n=1 Tax=Notamacropus eugenii TaxID=9315 RepID=UPI003B6718B7